MRFVAYSVLSYRPPTKSRPSRLAMAAPGLRVSAHRGLRMSCRVELCLEESKNVRARFERLRIVESSVCMRPIREHRVAVVIIMSRDMLVAAASGSGRGIPGLGAWGGSRPNPGYPHHSQQRD